MAKRSTPAVACRDQPFETGSVAAQQAATIRAATRRPPRKDGAITLEPPVLGSLSPTCSTSNTKHRDRSYSITVKKNKLPTHMH